ncbi:MAG: hypothetical protein ACRD9R_23500 [Pyrinomonadaceae bacterium]
MTRARSLISLGDLFRAVDRIRPPDEKTLRRVVELLGFEWNETVREALGAPPSGELTPPPARTVEDAKQEKERIPPPAPPAPPAPRPVSFELVTVTTDDAAEDAAEFDLTIEPLPVKSERELPRPLLEPLFVPRWTRGILTAALSTADEDGPPNVEELVEALASGRPIRRLPLLKRPTMRRGVQLLIDKSPAMLPYKSDAAWLEQEIKRTVGREGVQALGFSGVPRKAGPGPRDGWQTYRPPPPGTPVLALTDFGIGRPPFYDDLPAPDDWREFAAALRRANCPLVALVPYAPARWPRGLKRRLKIIQWDRRTTAASVRGIVGPAHEVTL